MANELTWMLEGRVLLISAMGDIAIEELRQMDSDILEMINSTDHSEWIHIVIDMRQVTQFPHNLQQIKQALTHVDNPHLGWKIMIGAGSITTFIANTVTQIARARFRAFSTMQEGLDFLTARDSALPKELPITVR